jgi:hypothetical protein
MNRWPERKLDRSRARGGGLLVLPGPERPRASVASGLKSEPLIPRRGGWNPRRRSFAEAGTPEGAERRDGAAGDGASAARVRWNLSA